MLPRSQLARLLAATSVSPGMALHLRDTGPSELRLQI